MAQFDIVVDKRHAEIKKIVLDEADKDILVFPDTFEGYEIKYIPFKIDNISEATFTKVKLPKYLKDIHTLFRGYKNLEEIEIPEGVRNIWQSFEGCINLKKVTIQEGLKHIYYRAFDGCVNLEHIEFPESLLYIEDSAFNNCINLKNVIIKNNKLYFSKESFTNTPFIQDCEDYICKGGFSLGRNFLRRISKCLCIVNQKTDTYTIDSSIKEINKFAFRNTDIKNIIVEGDIKVLEEGTFASISNLERVQLPDSLKEIGRQVFYKCSSLKKVEIPENVEKIGLGTFNGCVSLEKIVFQGNKINFLPMELFKNCSNLKEVHIPEGVEKVYNSTFDYCTSLERIYIPSTLKKLPKGLEGSLADKSLYPNFMGLVISKDNKDFSVSNNDIIYEDTINKDLQETLLSQITSSENRDFLNKFFYNQKDKTFDEIELTLQDQYHVLADDELKPIIEKIAKELKIEL